VATNREGDVGCNHDETIELKQMLSQASPGDDYARMFPDLPPLSLTDEHLTALAIELLQPVHVPDNPELPAGYTYFGQLVAHDLSRMLGARNLC
jgi:hypothetical protein